MLLYYIRIEKELRGKSRIHYELRSERLLSCETNLTEYDCVRRYVIVGLRTGTGCCWKQKSSYFWHYHEQIDY